MPTWIKSGLMLTGTILLGSLSYVVLMLYVENHLQVVAIANHLGVVSSNLEQITESFRNSASNLTNTTAGLVTLPSRVDTILRKTEGAVGSIDATVASLKPVAGNVDRLVVDLGKTVEKVNEDILPNVNTQVAGIGTSTQSLLTQSQKFVKDLEPQTLGFMAASKVAAGQIAKASITFDQAWPEIIAKTDKIIANSDRATDASARIASNFAEASKPLSKPWRIILGIAPPLAATGASAVGMGAAMGWFR